MKCTHAFNFGLSESDITDESVFPNPPQRPARLAGHYRYPKYLDLAILQLTCRWRDLHGLLI